MSISIDAETFSRRLKTLYDHWKENPEVWNNVSSFAIARGTVSEDLQYLKSVSLHLWLFGYEIPEAVMVFTETELHILSGPKKVSLLKPLEGPTTEHVGIKLIFHIKPKSEDASKQVSELMSVIKSSEPPAKIGSLPKEKPTGKICDKWQAAFAEVKENVLDVSAGLSTAMACKEPGEIMNMKKAAHLAAKCMNNFVVQQMETILDVGKKVKHSKLSTMVEKIIREPQKVGVKLKSENCDVAYPPIFQSGGRYDLKISAESGDKNLEPDAILCSLGTRYSFYCATIARCYLVDPESSMEEEYQALLAAQEAAIASLVDGSPLSNARQAAVKVLNEKNKPHLAKRLTKNIGFGMGLEIRDSARILNDKNESVAKPGMVFNVMLGVGDLEWPGSEEGKEKRYALQIADTVVVQEAGKPPEVLTLACPKTWNSVAYSLNDAEEEEEVEERPPPKIKAKEENLAPRRRDLRTEDPNYNNKEQQRKDIQDSLLEIKNQETLQRLMAGKETAAASASTSGRSIAEIVSYRSLSDIPAVRTLAIQVDQRNECVLVPLFGLMIPFHITTLKNISSQTDGDHAYIRLNFNFGGNYEPALKFPKLVFLKELSFRTSDVKHASKVVQEMKVFRSSVIQRDKERAERATLVRQEELVRGKRPFRLPDLWVRPALGGKGRRMSGTLEAHHNGFRYNAPRGEMLDIMYRNIRFAFLQPADNEMITILHFHLINPIMVGKKKTKDVQFYAEVMDVVQTLDGGKRHVGDPDEIEEEQREKDRCNKINKEFQVFVKRVQEHWEREFPDLRLEFDIPFRDLGFNGVPHKSNVFMMPTVNCLVELVEMPFTVVPLEDIEIVSLERVRFNLKNFDMAIIYKDFNRDVSHIYTISSHSLDTIKEWLTSVKIKYYETKLNLAWKPILKNIMEDPRGFVDNGGWKFLDVDASDSEEGETEASSDFQPDAEEMDESSDFESSDDESLVESDDSDAEMSEDEEAVDDGPTWEELEEEMKRQDRDKGAFDDSDDDQRSKKKRKKVPMGPNHGKRSKNF